MVTFENLTHALMEKSVIWKLELGIKPRLKSDFFREIQKNKNKYMETRLNMIDYLH